MHFWMAVVIIVSVTAFANFMKHRQDTQARIAAGRGNADDNAELLAEISALHSRIAVLERIITDNRSGQSLAHEIDALRDR